MYRLSTLFSAMRTHFIVRIAWPKRLRLNVIMASRMLNGMLNGMRWSNWIHKLELGNRIHLPKTNRKRSTISSFLLELIFISARSYLLLARGATSGLRRETTSVFSG